MKRWRVILVTALLLLFAVCLWAQQGKAIPEPKSKVKLDWWFQDWSGGIAWMKAYKPVYERNHPNVELNLIPVPFDDIFAKLIPSIAQGNDPDIMYSYDEWLVGKDVSKLFAPLTPNLFTPAEFKEYIYEAALKNVTAKNGNIYGLPWVTGANAFGFTYHKDLFKQAGVDAAKIKSWDDLKAASKKLTAYNADGTIKRSGILFTYTEAANALLDMIQMQGARDKMFDKKTNSWNFNIPEARKAMENFKWFVDNKTFDPQSGNFNEVFGNKLGSMLLIGPWFVGGSMTSFPELDVGYILMPPFPTAQDKLVLGSVISYAVFSTSKRLKGDKLNAAMLFVKDVMTKPADHYDLPFYNKPPFWVGAVTNKKYIAELQKRPPDKMTEFSQTCLTATNKGLPAVKTLEHRLPEPALIRQGIFPEMMNLFLGKKTIEEVLKYLTDNLTKQEKQLAL
jgi:ABC-type glycerol-3-phosphate transport system substrate-binding protein